MLNEKEFEQLTTAISLMHAPYSIGDRETCFKDNVIDLIKTFKEQETLGGREVR